MLVKSFALEMEEGNPASRRWIETRFLTKQQGEWYGYSYVWNDEQTDGDAGRRQGAGPRVHDPRAEVAGAARRRAQADLALSRAGPSAWSATAGPPTSCSA